MAKVLNARGKTSSSIRANNGTWVWGSIQLPCDEYNDRPWTYLLYLFSRCKPPHNVGFAKVLKAEYEVTVHMKSVNADK